MQWHYLVRFPLQSFNIDLGRKGGRRAVAAALYVVLCSSVVWLWRDDPSGVDGFLGGSTYVWICLGLLVLWPQASSRLPSCSCARRADEPGLETAP